MADALDQYRDRRRFERTPEPRGRRKKRSKGALEFVVQAHAARRMHYDFRLECDGVLKSWAIPKGPSMNPNERRLAVQTEDHPLEYKTFEGMIPEGEYGSGAVLVWDRGHWKPEGDAARALRQGKLDFELSGQKLRGRFSLVKMAERGAGRGKQKSNWLLIKRSDRAMLDYEPVDAEPESVITGRDLDAVRASRDRVWHSGSGELATSAHFDLQRLDALEGARRAALPQRVEPELATLVDSPPRGSGWFHEPKLDGYRLLCRKQGKKVSLHTRRGNDWTARFPGLVAAIAALPCDSALLDGEVVRFDSRGVSDFQALQNALSQDDAELELVLFDLLFLNGFDLRGVALRARKEQLRLLLADVPPPLRYGEHVEGHAQQFLRSACELGLEGIVSKRADAPYQGKRSKSWLKIKCTQRQEFVIVGYTEPQGARSGFGALLVATRDAPGEPLRYAGKVGTGFNEASLKVLKGRLGALERARPGFERAPRGQAARVAHWVEPQLVAEVEFSEWTQDGALRHPRFRGLREDKPAASIVKELPSRAAQLSADEGAGAERAPAATGSRGSGAGARVAGVAISHPQKLLYREPDISKLELARYYEAIAPRMVPLIRERPLTLYRCPEGAGGGCFFQKHIGPGVPDAILRVKVKQDEEPYAAVGDASSLVALAQIGALELHAWGSTRRHLDQPDVIVFDLDPDEELEWGVVARAALELKQRLADLGLPSFVRTTGGKGLHVVVPFLPGPNWSAVKRFTQAVAQEMVRSAPERFTAVMSKDKRHGKIFLDYLRNDREATAIASYSPRAKPGAPVAMPLFWEELDVRGNRPLRFGLRQALERVREQRQDPWSSFDQVRKKLVP